jgi:hypothetical protein
MPAHARANINTNAGPQSLKRTTVNVDISVARQAPLKTEIKDSNWAALANADDGF